MTTPTPRTDATSTGGDSVALILLARQLERDLAAANARVEELERENSKLRSALQIVHFKQEPWQ